MSSGDATLGVAKQFELLEKLVQKLVNKEAMATPQLGDKKEIRYHLEKMDQYFRMCGISAPETKIIILFNTLSDDMRFELCGVLEFKDHKDDYPWIRKKLLELFSPKETEITPLVKLYACKQSGAQSVREFLSEIRIEGYKLLKEIDPEEREKHLIDAFTKGLQNKELKAVLSRKKVATLDEAFRLVKKEKPAADTEYVRRIEGDRDQARIEGDQMKEIEKLQNQMLMVQKQLSYIVTILEKTRQPNRVSYAEITRRKTTDQEGGRNSGNLPQQSFQQNRIIQCWNCGLNGHIARFCRSKQCASCGQFGHISQNCRARQNHRRVRRIWEDKGDEEWETDSPCDKPSDVSSQENDTQGVNEMSDFYALTIHPQESELRRRVTNGKERTKKKHLQNYPEYIVELEEFVEGRRSKKNTCLPKEKASTMENNRSTSARNKPLVRGRCGGRHSKLFFDTGAEISVIDEGFIQQVEQQGNQVIRRHRQSKIIKCANNSRMDTKGWVRLQVQIGGQTKQCKFWVVRNLMPKVIIGIRAMKDMGVTVDPTRECIWADGVRIPFVSHVQPQSLFEASSGNAIQPGLGVEGRQ